MSRRLQIVIGVVVAVVAVALAVSQWNESRWLAAAALLVVAGLIVVSVVAAVRQQRSTDLRERVQSSLSGTAAGQGRDGAGDERAPSRPLRAKVVDAVAPDAEIAGIQPQLGSIVIGTLALALILGIVVATLFSSAWGLLAAFLVPLVTRSIVKRRAAKTRKLFEQELPDNLDVVSSALRVGHSLVGAFSVTVEAADEPSRTELGRAIADEQLGVPFDVALNRVATRMQSRDIAQVALIVRLQRAAGTNAAEVIDQVSENVRGRMDLERLVKTLTAQGRLARWIVSLLPVFLFGAMFVLNKEYLAPLWETPVGKMGMALAVIMIIAGSLIIKKIVEIEV